MSDLIIDRGRPGVVVVAFNRPERRNALSSEMLRIMEDAWDRLRAAGGEDGGKGALPRTVNFITGPSRTGDIEMRIELGAHGPRRLHILLVED